MTFVPSWQDDLPAELITPEGVDLDSAGPGEVLTGFLDGPIAAGRPDLQPTWRLYQTNKMDRYLEVQQGAIQGATRLPDGATLLRVAYGALIKSVTAFRAGQGGSPYLGGGIASQHRDADPYYGPDDPPASNRNPCPPSL